MIALVAILAGAVVPLLLVSFTDRRHRRTKLRDDARAACARSLSAGRAVMHSVLGLHGFRDHDPAHRADPSRLQAARLEGVGKVTVALAELYAATAEVDVVASPVLVDAVDGWRDQLLRLAHLESEPGDQDNDAWSTGLSAAVIAEERFVAMVRQQLGTDAGKQRCSSPVGGEHDL